MEWVNERKDKVVAEAKNMFAELGPLLKKPISHTGLLANKNTPVIGFEFIGAKVVICIIMMLIAIARIESALGGWNIVDGETKLKIALVIIVFVGGIDVLEAASLKLCTGMFGLNTSFNRMLTVMGTKALFDIVFIIIAGFLALVAPTLGVFSLVVGGMLSTYVQYGGFSRAVAGGDDKKPYIMAIAKVAVLIVVFLILSVVMDGFVDNLSYALEELFYGFY